MNKYMWAVAACIGIFCLFLVLEATIWYTPYSHNTFGWVFRQLCMGSAMVAAWRAIVKKPRGGVQMDEHNPGTYHAETGKSSAKETLTTVNDDVFYDEVAKEIETNNLISGVWTRAFAEADGDENRAKAIYIKRRVAQLAEEVKRTAMPTGGDAKVVSSEIANDRWVRNTCANGDVTMSDKDTGRVWLYSASWCGKKNLADAAACCGNLSYAGYSDWRLPNKDELSAQFGQKTFFAGVQDGYYWSGTSGVYNTGDAWYVDMGDGSVGSCDKSNRNYVWPVRGGK